MKSQGQGDPYSSQSPIPRKLPAPPRVKRPLVLVIGIPQIRQTSADNERNGNEPEIFQEEPDGGSHQDETFSLPEDGDRLRRCVHCSPLFGQRQRNQRKRDRGQQGLESHPARLPSYLRQCGFVFDPFHFSSQVAQTSRGQCHSGFVPPLKEAGRRAPEQE